MNKAWMFGGMIVAAMVLTLGGCASNGTCSMCNESQASAAPINSTCPASDDAIDPTVTSAYTVTFCCDKCKTKFDKDPAAYMQKVANAKPGECPMSGEDVDSDITSTVTIGFCCDKCKAKFDKDPKAMIGKVHS